MKIAVTSEGKTLDSEVDPRFGRAQYIIIINTENDKIEVLDNSAKLVRGGAGTQAAQFLSENGVKVLITGNVGPNAIRGLNAGKIDVYTGASGLVKDALDRYNEGKLNKAAGPTVNSHFGSER